MKPHHLLDVWFMLSNLSLCFAQSSNFVLRHLNLMPLGKKNINKNEINDVKSISWTDPFQFSFLFFLPSTFSSLIFSLLVKFLINPILIFWYQISKELPCLSCVTRKTIYLFIYFTPCFFSAFCYLERFIYFYFYFNFRLQVCVVSLENISGVGSFLFRSYFSRLLSSLLYFSLNFIFFWEFLFSISLILH